MEKFDAATDSLLAVKYIGDAGDCDVCGRPLSDELFFATQRCLPAVDGGGYLPTLKACNLAEV